MIRDCDNDNDIVITDPRQREDSIYETSFSKMGFLSELTFVPVYRSFGIGSGEFMVIFSNKNVDVDELIFWKSYFSIVNTFKLVLYMQFVFGTYNYLQEIQEKDNFRRCFTQLVKLIYTVDILAPFLSLLLNSCILCQVCVN